MTKTEQKIEAAKDSRQKLIAIGAAIGLWPDVTRKNRDRMTAKVNEALLRLDAKEVDERRLAGIHETLQQPVKKPRARKPKKSLAVEAIAEGNS